MLKNFLVGLIMAMVMISSNAFAQNRCFTFTGNVVPDSQGQTITASMGNAWIPQTPFAQAGVTLGMEVTYDVCVEQPAPGMQMTATIQGSNLFPVGGSGEPDNPEAYPRIDGELNTFHPDGVNGSAPRIQMGPDLNEYVMMHDFTKSFDEWEVGDAIKVQHTAFIDHNPDFHYNGNIFYDWVSRVYIEGTITAIDPVPVSTLDTEFCNNWQADGWQCIGKLTLESMGHFEPDGSFVWDGPEAAELLQFASGTPNGVDTPFKQFTVNGGTFSLRHFTDGSHVRIMSEVGEEIIGNEIVKANCFDPNMCGEGIGYFITPMPHEGCDGSGYIEGPQECVDAAPDLYPDGWFNPRDDHPLPCCRIWPNRPVQLAFSPANVSDITEVRWVEKDITGITDYRAGDGIFPKYKLYPMNFWDFDNAFEQVYHDFYTNFPMGILPEADSIQTIRFTLADGQVIEHQYRITDVAPMPIVAATKEVDGETKIIIHGKDQKIGLKLTWNDPPFKEIMKPGIQLRVYVGAEANEHDRYLWIDCPAQMHKMLIPKDYWDGFKDQLISLGHTEANIAIVYRTNAFADDLGTNYQNRGQSDIVAMPLQ